MKWTSIYCAISVLTSTADASLAIYDSVQASALFARGWIQAPSAAALQTQAITLEIGLTLRNTDELVAFLLDISDPKSPRYGNWLSKEAVDDLVRPSKESSNRVLAWLAHEGITATSSDGTWIKVQTNVQTANRLFAADFQHYQRDSVTKIRTTSYSLPEHLLDDIDLVHPTTFFGDTKPLRPALVTPTKRQVSNSTSIASEPTAPSEPSSTCHRSITPDCLRLMYNIGNYTPIASFGSKIAFTSFLNQSYVYNDLEIFQEKYNLAIRNASKVFVNDARNEQDDVTSSSAAEANLDVQTIMGLAGNLPVIEYLTDGSPPFIPDLEMTTASENTNEPYLTFYNYMLKLSNEDLPWVISSSYGEPEQTVPKAYAQRVCIIIAQLAVRGVSILESSGDTGVGSYCTKNDGSNQAAFLPQFPATCPWITAVGGTQSFGPETAWVDSSGGFSNYWPRPKYQKEAVASYLSTKLSNDVLQAYSAYANMQQGRGFPDISAHSWAPYYETILGGGFSVSGGTSAAAPVWAAIVGLLNDARLRAGKPPMGFLNPWLYGEGLPGLVDVQVGKSRGCDGVNHQTGRGSRGSSVIAGAGWNATAGWDPVTGLGIPDFRALLKLALER